MQRLSLTILAALALVACGGDDAGGSAAAGTRLASVSGVVQIAPGSAVDGTVNDPAAAHLPNDSFATAQPLPNPVALGGYANRVGHGPAGRFHAGGDEYDYYRVSLAAGDAVVLRIANDDPTADLDLYLADASRTLVDASLDPDARIESLVAPATGEYYVVVHAAAGASAYALSVGPGGKSLEQQGWRLSDAFLPGEAIVLPAVGEKVGETPRNRLFRFASEKHATERFDAFSFADSETRTKLETLHAIKRMRRDGAFRDAQPNFVYELAYVTPSDPLYRYQWHYGLISLPGAWPTTTGDGTVVAVLDSGVALDHPGLRTQLTPGWDFVRGIAGGDEVNGSGYHGTHVAGTVAAAADNGIGGTGVAPGARVMPVRVCAASCSGYAIEQGLRYAAGLPNDSGRVPAEPAQVINLSLGRVGGATSGEQRLFDQLYNLGVTVVAAAGNQNTTARAFPAAYRGVIAVGAVDLRGRRAPYSNYGSWIDVVAPGGDLARDDNGDGYGDGVLSTWVNDQSGSRVHNHRFMQGTSMASPHVAGVVALMKAAAPGFTAADVFSLIRADALTDDLGAPGRDDIYGHGLINAEKAVAAAVAAAGMPAEPMAVLAVSPSSLGFGTGTTRLDVTLSNAGGGTLITNAPTISADWLKATRNAAAGDDTWTLTASRAGLAPGSYATTVRFTSNANTVEVDVTLQVAPPVVADIGRVYVLLIDPNDGATRYQATVEPFSPGMLRFRFAGVAPGEYRLVAGSDLDNNQKICEATEACGALGRVITVGDDELTGVDVTVGFPSPQNESRTGHQRMR